MSQKPFAWRIPCLALAVAAMTFGSAAHAGGTPLGSTITYQGVLKSADSPFTGAADVRFTLYDALSRGSMVGAPVTSLVDVVDGQFTTSLDFGALAFNGDERWMEIEVIAPSTGGVGSWTVLTPRQRIAPAPYALRALNASVSGAQPSQVSFSNAANEFTGTSMNIDSGTFQVDPVLDAVGVGIVPDSAYRLRVAAAGNDYGLSATAGGTGAAVGGLNLNPAGHAAYFEGRSAFMGSVGIGTDNPQESLHIVDGGIIVDPFGVGGFSLLHMDGASTIGGLGESSGSGFYMGNYSAGPLVFGTQTTPGSAFERMRITPSGNVGIGTSVPTAKLHIGGTPGEAAVRYSDGSVATRAPTGVFASNTAPAPTVTLAFISATVVITVTSSSQQFLVQADRAFGSTSAGGANGLALWIGAQPTGGGTIQSFGGGVLDLAVAQNMRHIFGLSAVITGLAPGTYNVGLVGQSASPNWNSNEWGYTTAISLN